MPTRRFLTGLLLGAPLAFTLAAVVIAVSILPGIFNGGAFRAQVGGGSCTPTFTEYDVPVHDALEIVAGPDGKMWFTEGVTRYPATYVTGITTAGVMTVSHPTHEYLPTSLALGPDGNLWFTAQSSAGGLNYKIGRLTVGGMLTWFTGPAPQSSLNDIVAGPDGNLWFTEYPNKIGRITPSGAITEFTIPYDPFAVAQPVRIAAGPDGALWFTESAGKKIGRITTGGAITEYPIPASVGSTRPYDIAAGPDGALWFTMPNDNRIGRITTDGAFAGYVAAGTPWQITAGADGNLWITGRSSGKLMRMTPGGNLTAYAPPTPNNQPSGITPGPGGTIWFTEFVTGRNEYKVVKFTPCPSSPSSSSSSSSSAGVRGGGGGDSSSSSLPSSQSSSSTSSQSSSSSKSALSSSSSGDTGPDICTPICGDGKVVGPEECDDGNTKDGDGCSSTCTLTHADCRDGKCASVAGPGKISCNNATKCELKHAECNDKKQCVAVDGAGKDVCQVDKDCTESHADCRDQQCMKVPGAGKNACSDDAICIDKHAECNDKKQCVAVDGAGKDVCQVDKDCRTSSSSSASSKESSSSSKSSASSKTSSQSSASSKTSSKSSASSSKSSAKSSSSTSSTYECLGNECAIGGTAYCAAFGKRCEKDLGNPICIRCEPDSINCTNTMSECQNGGEKYCKDTFGATATCAPSKDGICIVCKRPGQCTNTMFECENGGAAYCKEAFGTACSPKADGLCIQCGPPPDGCQGNECRIAGAAYCAREGMGCKNIPDGICIACTPEPRCESDRECARGASCINGGCVQLCGNGRIDRGEACDGGAGCTRTCLLEERQQCTADTECDSTLCLRNLCIPCTAGDQCQSSDCREGTCTNLCGNGQVDPGEICDPGPDGSSANCTANCLRPVGTPCDRQQECQTGLCGAGTCTACTAGTQCSSGLCVSGGCSDTCGDGTVQAGEDCDDGNRKSGDGCSRFCGRETGVAGEVIPVSLIGDVARGGVVQGLTAATRTRGAATPEQVRAIAAAHPAAGETGPAALVAIAAGAAAGWSYMRRRRSEKS